MRARKDDSSSPLRRSGHRDSGGRGGFRRAGASAAASLGPGAAVVSAPDGPFALGTVSAAVSARLGLASAWMAAAGALTARRCPVVGVASGELRVRVPDARWQRELERHAREIIVRLGALGVNVGMLRVIVDTSLVDRPPVDPSMAGAAPLDPALPDGGNVQAPGAPTPPAGGSMSRLESLRASYMAAARRQRGE